MRARWKPFGSTSDVRRREDGSALHSRFHMPKQRSSVATGRDAGATFYHDSVYLE